jgi:mono/diheme cytochrome c family protein
MKKLIKRVFSGILALVVLATTALVVAVLVNKDKTYAAPYPDLHASKDPAVIARGKYLVEGPAHCGDCHGAAELDAERHAGMKVPLSGGHEWRLPFGIVRAPNITSDPETGIGRLTDGEIARVLRHGVAPSGRAVLPFMPFADLSDEDLTAVISYVRTFAPVKKPVVRMELNALGVAVTALMIEPHGPTASIQASVPRGPTAEYGGYLANNVANCVKCHSVLDMRTGERVGPAFAGSEPVPGEGGRRFQAPNLTPHPTAGWITSWKEEDFVARFKSGARTEGSPMPWHSFARMSEDDLRALYRYLRTLPPVDNRIERTVLPGEVSMR